MFYMACSKCGHIEPFMSLKQVVGSLDYLQMLYWPHTISEDGCLICDNKYLHFAHYEQKDFFYIMKGVNNGQS
jgi:hypothetical protein